MSGEHEHEREQGIDLSEIVSGGGDDDGAIANDEEHFTEDLHEAIASSLASEADEIEQQQSPESADSSATHTDTTRCVDKECAMAGLIVGAMLVVMLALLLMGYFIGYYDGDSNAEKNQDRQPEMANGTLAGL